MEYEILFIGFIIFIFFAAVVLSYRLGMNTGKTVGFLSCKSMAIDACRVCNSDKKLIIQTLTREKLGNCTIINLRNSGETGSGQ
jgi:hypothetical protein